MGIQAKLWCKVFTFTSIAKERTYVKHIFYQKVTIHSQHGTTAQVDSLLAYLGDRAMLTVDRNAPIFQTHDSL